MEVSYFADPVAKIEFERTVKKFLGLPADEAAVKSALKSLEAYLDVANDLLRDKGYMAGKDFSLVDIYHLPLVQRLFTGGFGDVIDSREHVRTWWQRCSSRPAVKKLLDQ